MATISNAMLAFPNDIRAKIAWHAYASSFNLDRLPFDSGRKLLPEAFNFDNVLVEPLNVLSVKCLAKSYKCGPINPSIDAYNRIKFCEFLDIEIPIENLTEIDVSFICRLSCCFKVFH